MQPWIHPKSFYASCAFLQHHTNFLKKFWAKCFQHTCIHGLITAVFVTFITGRPPSVRVVVVIEISEHRSINKAMKV